MRPPMIVALLACLALTMYVAMQPDADEDLAPLAERQPGGGPRAVPPLAGASAASRAGQTGQAAALADVGVALAAWHQRRVASGANQALSAANALTSQAWAPQQPPPPPPPLAEAPPPPTAPPFPHDWVGRYLDPQPRAIVAGPLGTWVVKVGDVMEGQWRIDAIAERRMTLTYLPLSQSQTVAMK